MVGKPILFRGGIASKYLKSYHGDNPVNHFHYRVILAIHIVQWYSSGSKQEIFLFVEGVSAQGIFYVGGTINDLPSSNVLLKTITFYHGLVISDKGLVFGYIWKV